MKNMKTYTPKKGTIQKKWYLVDAQGKTLGRTATKIADILRGKNKPEYSPWEDVGDYVVVINADKIEVTGNKEKQKMYYRHSGYPGGLKMENFRVLREKNPEKIILNAVKGMLPKNKLSNKQITKLKVCRGDKHHYQAQKPEKIEV